MARTAPTQLAPYMPPPRAPDKAQQLAELVRANLAEVVQQLSELPAVTATFLAPPLYFLAGSRSVMEKVAFGDFKLPPKQFYSAHGNGIRLINEPHRIYGVDGRGKVLWECPDAYRVPYANEIRHTARLRGFEIKQDYEFPEWLTANMQDFLQAAQNDGWPAQEASLRQQLTATLTTAAKPAGKAQ